MNYIKFFNQISLSESNLVGGKNAALGHMIQHVTSQGILIPDGFAITVAAYHLFLEKNNLTTEINTLLKNLTNLAQVSIIGSQIRNLIATAIVPQELQEEIVQTYDILSHKYGSSACAVAVRSSGIAEDSATASFAGQQETFVNVIGASSIIEAYHKACASLFTDRALAYRIEKNITKSEIGISVGVQKLVRSDLASSGVMFTLDTETGFKDAIIINASYGLGESIVSGAVTPDEFCVFKPTGALIKSVLGDKKTRIICKRNGGTEQEDVPPVQRLQFSLTHDQIKTLAQKARILEEYFSHFNKRWTPLDIEWALDGIDNKLYIVQARPETVHAEEHKQEIEKYVLDEQSRRVLVQGQAIGQKIISGTARIITNFSEAHLLKEGDILITAMTNPDWVPYMKKAAGIVTDFGGRTCHAAIVSRELGLTAIIGTEKATRALKNGQQITLDCSSGAIGHVYEGTLAYHIESIAYSTPSMPIKLLVNLADPDAAFKTAQLPVDGVGLARIEFIITHMIGVHPLALLHPERTNDATRQLIKSKTAGYADYTTFFIEKLSQGIGMITAAFYPKPVIVRLSDFKSNEYGNLIGGSFFEQHEENPMIGLRGASRYTHSGYSEAFELECAALVRARIYMGFDTIKIMIPFVRTVAEARKTIKELAKNNLIRGKNKLEFYMMVEIPSNVLLIEEFATLFDGFSIGSNDLTQLTLGVDRDSTELAKIFDERDPAVQKMIRLAIAGAHQASKPIGICGQAPSDYPEMADQLIKEGIDSLSLNSDSIVSFLKRYAS